WAGCRDRNVRHCRTALVGNNTRDRSGCNTLRQCARYQKSKNHERQNKPQNSFHGLFLSCKLDKPSNIAIEFVRAGRNPTCTHTGGDGHLKRFWHAMTEKPCPHKAHGHRGRRARQTAFQMQSPQTWLSFKLCVSRKSLGLLRKNLIGTARSC